MPGGGASPRAYQLGLWQWSRTRAAQWTLRAWAGWLAAVIWRPRRHRHRHSQDCGRPVLIIITIIIITSLLITRLLPSFAECSTNLLSRRLRPEICSLHRIRPGSGVVSAQHFITASVAWSDRDVSSVQGASILTTIFRVSHSLLRMFLSIVYWSYVMIITI